MGKERHQSEFMDWSALTERERFMQSVVDHKAVGDALSAAIAREKKR